MSKQDKLDQLDNHSEHLEASKRDLPNEYLDLTNPKQKARNHREEEEEEEE